jgi:hypothetical protein
MMMTSFHNLATAEIEDITHVAAHDNVQEYYRVRINITDEKGSKDQLTFFSDSQAGLGMLGAPDMIRELLEGFNKIDERDCTPELYEWLMAVKEDLESVS